MSHLFEYNNNCAGVRRRRGGFDRTMRETNTFFSFVSRKSDGDVERLPSPTEKPRWNWVGHNARIGPIHQDQEEAVAMLLFRPEELLHVDLHVAGHPHRSGAEHRSARSSYNAGRVLDSLEAMVAAELDSSSQCHGCNQPPGRSKRTIFPRIFWFWEIIVCRWKRQMERATTGRCQCWVSTEVTSTTAPKRCFTSRKYRITAPSCKSSPVRLTGSSKPWQVANRRYTNCTSWRRRLFVDELQKEQFDKAPKVPLIVALCVALLAILTVVWFVVYRRIKRRQRRRAIGVTIFLKIISF